MNTTKQIHFTWLSDFDFELSLGYGKAIRHQVPGLLTIDHKPNGVKTSKEVKYSDGVVVIEERVNIFFNIVEIHILACLLTFASH